MPATDPVQAVAEALHADQCPDDECDGSDMGEYDRMAEIAVAEAEPHLTREAKAAVAAARPTIEAQALRDAADALNANDPAGDAVFWDGRYYQFVADWLHDRADDLEAGL